MFNPTGTELDDLHRRSLVSPGARAAFKTYVTAVSTRDAMVDQGRDVKSIGAEIAAAHAELERLLFGGEAN